MSRLGELSNLDFNSILREHLWAPTPALPHFFLQVLEA